MGTGFLKCSHINVIALNYKKSLCNWCPLQEDAHKAVDQLNNHTLGNRTISVAMSNPPARGHHGNRPPPHPQGRSPVEVAMDTSKPQEESEAVDVRYNVNILCEYIRISF